MGKKRMIFFNNNKVYKFKKNKIINELLGNEGLIVSFVCLDIKVGLQKGHLFKLIGIASGRK